MSFCMMNGKDKRNLRARGNRIRPAVSLGKAGLTQDTIAFIGNAFSKTDLIKVKIQRSFPGERYSLAKSLAQLENTEVIQVLGNTILLYRPLPESE
jgi:RNA-binding protein